MDLIKAGQLDAAIAALDSMAAVSTRSTTGAAHAIAHPAHSAAIPIHFFILGLLV